MSNLLITLCVGLIIGYAAQRSRFCLIGGVRDYMIVKDKYLLKGMFALLITAALLFLALHLLGVHQENMKNYPMFIKDTTDQQVIEASACANTKPLYLFLKKAGGTEVQQVGRQAGSLGLLHNSGRVHNRHTVRIGGRLPSQTACKSRRRQQERHRVPWRLLCRRNSLHAVPQRFLQGAV